MRRFLIGVLAITLLSIFYVFQQARLLEYSYTINSNHKYISLLIDRNKQLGYNVAKLETPYRLEDIMLAKKEAEPYSFEAWHKIQVREEKASSLPQAVSPAGPFIKPGKVLLSMFSLATEAVADELNE